MPPAVNTASASRRQQKEATRRAILDAAIDCFARRGYDGTNFRAISERCGAQRALILYHFENKENLWRLAVEEVEQRFTQAFERRCEPERQATDRDKIRHTLHAYIDAMLKIPEYGQILLREGSAQGPRMEWLSHHFAPQRSLQLNLDDRELEYRVKKTIVRDILAATLISFIGLAPLLDASLAVATKQRTAGIYPLSSKRKNEFVEYLVGLVCDADN